MREEAISFLRQAADGWEKMRWHYYHAMTCQQLARELLERARQQSTHRNAVQVGREEAEELLDMALSIYDDLGIPAGMQAVLALRTSTHLESQRKRRQTLETRHSLGA